MFRQYKDIATIYRQSYQNKKSTYSSTGLSCVWYLHPLSPEKNQVALDKYWKEFSYTTSVQSDVKETDKLLIDGTYYRVKGVAPYTGIIVRYKRILLVKEEVWS